jgi:hypothetical protein
VYDIYIYIHIYISPGYDNQERRRERGGTERGNRERRERKETGKTAGG